MPGYYKPWECTSILKSEKLNCTNPVFFSPASTEKKIPTSVQEGLCFKDIALLSVGSQGVMAVDHYPNFR